MAFFISKQYRLISHNYISIVDRSGNLVDTSDDEPNDSIHGADDDAVHGATDDGRPEQDRLQRAGLLASH